MVKKYDLFISHSSKDKAFIHKLADDLKARGLAVWYDKWEMKPGERLRDRINDGITRSQYFLVALSPNSVDASWVRIELDSAMIKELENNRVVVIPVMLGKVSDSDIPPDLKGKHYLDFRNTKEYSNNIERILSIFDLEKREHRKYLNQLKDGDLKNSNAIEQLTSLARGYGDQAVQRSAITGLSKHASNPKAILGIADRLLNNWGMSVIQHTIKTSARLIDYGGLILLSSTLFYDNRFISAKLDEIKKSLAKIGNDDAILELNSLGDEAELHREPSKVNRWMSILSKVSHPDIREGAIFGSQYEGLAGWQSHVLEICSSNKVSKACIYVESRIPGLVKLYNRQLRRKYLFQWEKSPDGKIELKRFQPDIFGDE